MEEVVLLEVHRVQRRRAENKLSPEFQVGLIRRDRPHVYRVPIPTTQVRNVENSSENAAGATYAARIRVSPLLTGGQHGLQCSAGT